MPRLLVGIVALYDMQGIQTVILNYSLVFLTNCSADRFTSIPYGMAVDVVVKVCACAGFYYSIQRHISQAYNCGRESERENVFMYAGELYQVLGSMV